MREFDSFLKNLAVAELAVFLITFGLVLSLKGFSSFSLSFLIGYAVSLFDLFLIARFSKRTAQLAVEGYFPRSGFFWRFMAVGLILFALPLFTQVNFFAIISAVAAANLGLFVAVILSRKEWEKWNTEA